MFLFHIYLETFLIFRDIISEKIFTKIAAGDRMLFGLSRNSMR